MDRGEARKLGVRAFEDEAEVLLAYQLDLLAQLESQLRATHQMMRQIEKLRTARKRVGPELSNGQRGDALAHLSAELDGLDAQVNAQRELCVDMHRTVDAMHGKLHGFRRVSQESRQHSTE